MSVLTNVKKTLPGLQDVLQSGVPLNFRHSHALTAQKGDEEDPLLFYNKHLYLERHWYYHKATTSTTSGFTTCRTTSSTKMTWFLTLLLMEKNMHRLVKHNDLSPLRYTIAD